MVIKLNSNWSEEVKGIQTQIIKQIAMAPEDSLEIEILSKQLKEVCQRELNVQPKSN